MRLRLHLRLPSRAIRLPSRRRVVRMRRLLVGLILGAGMGTAFLLAARTPMIAFAVIFIMAVCVLLVPESEDRGDVIAPWQAGLRRRDLHAGIPTKEQDTL